MSRKDDKTDNEKEACNSKSYGWNLGRQHLMRVQISWEMGERNNWKATEEYF